MVARRSIRHNRALIAVWGILIAGTPSFRPADIPAGEISDKEVSSRVFQFADAKALEEKPIGEVLKEIGTFFLGSPYIAHSLEAPGEETLVVNLRAFDCVTFVENTLALSRCVKLKKTTFEEFTYQLQLIRYRSGVIDQYPSRLHYFSDWIFDNDRKDIVRDVTAKLGGVVDARPIKFMSSHPTSYRQLKNDEHLAKIRLTESELNSRGRVYIPKDRVAQNEDQINDGDIIAITTSIEGLDVSHTGLAIRVHGEVKYLHAPLSQGTVQISKGSLSQYLLSQKRHTGIIIARPVDINE